MYRKLFELSQLTQRPRFLCLYLGWGLDNPEFEYKEDDVGERLKRAASPEELFFSIEEETIRLRSDSSMQSQIPSVRSFLLKNFTRLNMTIRKQYFCTV